MGQRGPRTQPTALKILRGNPGHRPLNKREPKPKLGCVPSDIVRGNARALQEWEKLSAMLTGLRVLTEADYIALGNLCLDVAMLEEARAGLAREGLMLKNKRTGVVHVNPLARVVATTGDRIARSLREFGLTPASRSSIQTTSQGGAEVDDPWTDLLAN